MKIISKIKVITGAITNENLADKIGRYGKQIDPSRVAKWNTRGFHRSTEQLILLLINEIEFRDETIKLLNYYDT